MGKREFWNLSLCDMDAAVCGIIIPVSIMAKNNPTFMRFGVFMHRIITEISIIPFLHSLKIRVSTAK